MYPLYSTYLTRARVVVAWNFLCCFSIDAQLIALPSLSASQRNAILLVRDHGNNSLGSAVVIGFSPINHKPVALTAAHVVEAGGPWQAATYLGHTSCPTRPIKIDALVDLALLEISTSKQTHFLPLGKKGYRLTRGDLALLAGFPDGVYQETSATFRETRYFNQLGFSARFIRFSGPALGGNSGGPFLVSNRFGDTHIVGIVSVGNAITSAGAGLEEIYSFLEGTSLLSEPSSQPKMDFPSESNPFEDSHEEPGNIENSLHDLLEDLEPCPGRCQATENPDTFRRYWDEPLDNTFDDENLHLETDGDDLIHSDGFAYDTPYSSPHSEIREIQSHVHRGPCRTAVSSQHQAQGFPRQFIPHIHRGNRDLYEEQGNPTHSLFLEHPPYFKTPVDQHVSQEFFFTENAFDRYVPAPNLGGVD